MNVTATGRGWTGTSLLSIATFLKSLVSGETKDGRVLSAQHEAALSSAMDHLRQADALMGGVIAAHSGNMDARHGSVDEPEVADPMPMKGTTATKSNNRWIFPRGR